MRIVIRAALAVMLVLTVGVGTVAAHECYVVNRSAQGNAGASHSQRWFTLTLEQLFAETENFGLPDLTAGQVDWAVAQAESLGVPSSFTIRTDKTIAEGTPGMELAGHSTDGKGVDHFIDAYGETLIGLVFEALGH
jgi:hypothetical protein